jgi:hypothetical protein
MWRCRSWVSYFQAALEKAFEQAVEEEEAQATDDYWRTSIYDDRNFPAALDPDSGFSGGD